MRKISLDDMQIFRCVALEGGIVRAANKLNRVPSNVTKRIKQFEERLGVKLLSRQGRGVVLTEDGQTLLGHSERLLRLADEIEQDICGDAVRGILRLGSLESAASVQLPPFLSQYHANYPETRLELQTGTTETLLRRVNNYQIEAAFVSEPFAAENLSSMKVFEEELVLITAHDTPRIEQASDLINHTVVAFPHGCSYRRRLVEWLAAEGVSPERFLDLGSYHAIVACVTAGTGVAVVPIGVLDNAVSASHVKRHRLPGALRFNTTHLVWNGEPTAQLSALINLLSPPI